ncbi:MAG: ABC transporter ATP-binding protein/permease [Eggerthellaceae bacterium]|nr:ABC transporter ATP-binding protein/permease [Eggerthellaceae bacterium]
MRSLKYLKPYLGIAVLIVVLLGVQAACDLAIPNFTSLIVDVGIQQSGIEASSPQEAAELLAEYQAQGVDTLAMQQGYIIRIGLQMLGVTLLGIAAAVGISFLAGRASASVGRDLRERLFDKVVSFSNAEVQSFSVASLITRATNDIQRIQMVSYMLLRIVIYAPILAVGGIVMVLQANASMTWIIGLGVLVVVVVIGVLMVVTMPRFRRMQKLIDKVNLISREMLTGIPVIRAFNRQGREEERFSQASGDLRDTQLFVNRAMSFMRPGMMLVMNAMAVLIVWVGAGAIDVGNMQTGDVMAFVTYSMAIVSSFMMLSMLAILLPRAEVSAKRIDEVLEADIAISDPARPRDGERSLRPGAEIEFRDVTFAYEGSDEPVLSHVSFTVPAGGYVALVGPTGSGKSTVFKLLMRDCDPQSGSILVDGVEARLLSLAALRGTFGYVPQTSFLFSGSIASNIAYGLDEVDEAANRWAASIAQADSFVQSLPEGYDSDVSQGGTNLSGGQRQRLAIARALAVKPRCFLFDDSMSALDYATELELRRSLQREMGSATRIVVSSRVATVSDADCIVVFDEGRVVGTGTHDELLASCATYADIARSQFAPQSEVSSAPASSSLEGGE